MELGFAGLRWKVAGEALVKRWEGAGKVLEKRWIALESLGCAGKPLERRWKSPGKALETALHFFTP